jgi:hypothetical protein
MPRHRNDLKTEELTLATTPQVVGYLKQLLRTGLYGKNPADAAERLLTRALEQFLAARRIRPPRGG